MSVSKNFSGFITFLFIPFLALSKVHAHAVPTHANITEAAVNFASKVDETLACSNNLEDVLQIGTEAEDESPRFMFHFYPALNDGRAQSTCSSRDWAFNEAACTQEVFFASTLTNAHRWSQALANSQTDQGLTDLGFITHLFQDLTSPAHTRNDAHPPGLDGDPVEAITRTPTMPNTSEGFIPFQSAASAFDALQTFTSTNFYSSDTVFTGIGPVAATQDDEYFYDADGDRIAFKSMAYKFSEWTTADPTQATINATIATEQFAELGPVAVRYSASLLKHYVDVAKPELDDCFIDFEEFQGGSTFTSIDPPLTTENATVSGGQIISGATFLPVNRTTTYGTAFFCSGCESTINIDFSNPVDNLSFLLMNGQVFTVTYTTRTDKGDEVTRSLVANSQQGAAVIDLPSNDVMNVTISGDADDWDFFIDNIRYKLSAVNN